VWSVQTANMMLDIDGRVWLLDLTYKALRLIQLQLASCSVILEYVKSNMFDQYYWTGGRVVGMIIDTVKGEVLI
jgi:hypothetical protein